MRGKRRGGRSTSVRLTDKIGNPLLNAVDVEGRWGSIFDVLVVVGSAIVLLAIVGMGVFIWILPTKK